MALTFWEKNVPEKTDQTQHFFNINKIDKSQFTCNKQYGITLKHNNWY